MSATVYYGPEQIHTTEFADTAIKTDHEMLVKVMARSILGSGPHL